MYPKILGSVDNQEKMSRMLESGGRLILALTALFGIDQAPVNDAVQITGQIVVGIYGLIHLGRSGYGAWRKVYKLFEEKFDYPDNTEGRV